MHRWQDGDMALVNTPRSELALWEAGLVRSAKNLNQWEVRQKICLGEVLPDRAPGPEHTIHIE